MWRRAVILVGQMVVVGCLLPRAEAGQRLSAGVHHTCGVLESGAVKCWGFDGSGRLRVPAGAYRSVASGVHHTCGVLESGAVKCWGSDDYGQLRAPGGAYRSVSAGSYHTCGVLESGAVKCWGEDKYGRLRAPGGAYRSVSAGGAHTCGVLESGAVKCWGFDWHGRLRAPAGVYRSVSAGSSHTCGVLESGAVKCWGSSTLGEATPPPGLTIATGGTEPIDGKTTDTKTTSLGKFTTDLRGAAGRRVLEMEIQVETDATTAVMVKNRMPQLRNSVIRLASDYSYAELEGIVGKLQLRDEIQASVNAVLSPAQVNRVYFTQFSME